MALHAPGALDPRQILLEAADADAQLAAVLLELLLALAAAHADAAGLP